ncbi:MAG: DNA topoisomerase, partial [Desulfobulbaceae bacterium]|nr:DNA topoisomerase [Desulfobulbaceae bacterium]
MGRMLVVVDSEDKIAALQSQFDGDIELYVLSAPPLKVAMKPGKAGAKGGSGNYSFSFSLLESGKPLLKKLRQFAGGEICLAFDSDPRGEFLGWLVAKVLEIDSPASASPRRIHVLAFHGEELSESFQNVLPVQEEKAMSYHVRSIFDMALGKHLNRLLGTQNGPAGLKLSTSCMATILLLAEREAEIKAYASRPKQRLMAQLASGDISFTALLTSVEGVSEDGNLYYDEDIEAIQHLLRDAEFVVGEVVKTPLVIAPPPPYHLVDLLEDAFVAHGISLGKTMSAVRRLFNGVELEDGISGLVSTFAGIDIANAALIENVRREVASAVGDHMLQPDGAVASGEGFLLPIRLDVDLESLANVLDEDEYRIYAMIRDRALASQLRPAEGDAIEVEISVGDDCYFKASGNDISSPGYLAFFPDLRGGVSSERSPLAGLESGLSLSAEEIEIEPVESTFASYYTIESLFVDLTDFSIEPGALSVAMLHRLVLAGYVEILGNGELRCLENVNKVTATLGRAFPSMTGISFSAYLEQTIGEVLSGRKALDFALQQFDQTMVMKGKVLQKVSLADQMQARLRKRQPRGVIKGGAARPPVAPPSVAKSKSSGPEVEAKDELLAANEEELKVDSAVEPAPEIVEEEIATKADVEAGVEEDVPGLVASEDIVAAPEDIAEEQVSVEIDDELDVSEPVLPGEQASLDGFGDSAAVVEDVASVDLVFDGEGELA